MKHFIFMIAMNLVSLFLNAQISGCLASYNFNNGNANDNIGTNHGVVNGPTLTTDRFGNPYHAYHFDASNLSRIEIPNHSSNDFITASTFSISLWAKFDSTNGESSLISKHAFPAWDGYAVWSNNTTDLTYCNGVGTLAFYTASAPMEDACANTLVALDFNNWQHIVVTYAGTVNSSKLYINNVLQTDIGSNSGIIASGTELIVGAAMEGLTSTFHSFFTGKLDDIGIYDRALNSSEVDSLYHAPNPVWSTSVTETMISNQLIEIYPNPAHDIVNFSRECDASIIDIVGNIKMQAHHVKSLDISALSKGIYIVRYANPTGQIIYTNKLVVD